MDIQKEDKIKEYFEEKRLEELKKKKSAEAYFLAVYFEKVKELAIKESAESINRFFDALSQKSKEDRLRTLKAIEAATHLFNVGQAFEKNKNEFFKLDDSKPETKEIKENLKKANIPEEKFSSIALAFCGKQIKNVVNFFTKPKEQQEPEEVAKFNSIRDESILAVKKGLFEYAKGKPELFAETLKEGLRIACEAFTKEDDKDKSMQWSMLAGDLLGTIEKDPALLKAAKLNKNQLEIAKKVAFMGTAIKEGLKAVEIMSKNALEGKAPESSYEKNKLAGAVANMEVVALDRQEIVVNWDDPVIEKPEIKAPVNSMR